jgi:hypothetical protein
LFYALWKVYSQYNSQCPSRLTGKCAVISIKFWRCRLW